MTAYTLRAVVVINVVAPDPGTALTLAEEAVAELEESLAGVRTDQLSAAFVCKGGHAEVSFEG